MIKRNDITNDIRNYLEYDETSSTGLRWKKITGKRVMVGNEAGYLNNRGYYTTTFNDTQYKNHRIVFFLNHGYCPDILDHIDNDTKNNNINNLREANHEQNNQNAITRKDNKTGVKGLTISQNTYWQLQIKKNGKVAFIEYHKLTDKTKDECRIILENKRKELHGAFANHG